METKTDHKEKREALREMSKQVKPLVQSEQFDTVNEAVIELFYRDEDNEEFNTLQEWNKKGFKVKKGSKAFVVWGSPRKLKATDPAPDDTEETNKDKFYPLCYLFSNAQVERRAA
ncbi:ArdC-like ssDNA-binding domain-containing protein [Massilibacteroides sp.]|uniref:ArdC-like ssDNA-binding domain-containing protein n=1 Tax=Massilibacteroides sp. TaxID=2034766 RepID=UPI00260B0D80|nr:ArdC-like ssDNA-binding domain-containing protein [Massilibacteroides sp.]MDD4515378.1 ArdC-like ssDNA-binding domain-containing protein [Massilibacteroides sp.]